MTRDDIIRMAREAELFQHVPPTSHVLFIYGLMAFTDLVAAAEREACAKVCEAVMPNPVKNWADAQIVNALRDCAAAIRARKEKT